MSDRCGRGYASRFYKRARQPTHARAGLRHPRPIRTPAAVRWDSYTIRGAEEPAGLSRIRDRQWPWQYNETPCPRRHTTEIPICPAWKARRNCRGTSSYDCGHIAVRTEVAAGWGRLRARFLRHNCKTAWTTAAPQTLAAALGWSHRRIGCEYVLRKIRQPPQCER